MSPLDASSHPPSTRQAPGPRLAAGRRARLIRELAAGVILPTLVERLVPRVSEGWRHEAAELAVALPEMDLSEAIAAVAAVNPGGRRFRAVCRDIILPSAQALRERFDFTALDQPERLMQVWRLRMVLRSLDDAAAPGPVVDGLHSALTLSGPAEPPSVEHGVALRFFDRAGWEVCDCCCHHAEEACDSVHDQDFDVAWISLEPWMDAAAVRGTARDIRRASRNARIRVVGGGVMGLPARDPRAFDLDGFTGSAIEAAVIAEAALRREAPRPDLR